jgi:hypothetical protein
VAGLALAQTVPDIRTYGEEADKLLNACVSNLKTSKEVKISERTTQTLIDVSKAGHHIVGVISWVIKSRHDKNILYKPVGRRHEETLKLKQRKNADTSLGFVIFLSLATAAEDRTFTLPQPTLCFVIHYFFLF